MENGIPNTVESEHVSETQTPSTVSTVPETETVYTFELVIQDMTDLARAVNAISSEMKVTVDRDKIMTRTVDPAHIAMVESQIENQASNYWRNIENLEIGFDTDQLVQCLKGIDKKDRLDCLSMTVKLKPNGLGTTIDIEVDGLTYSMHGLDTTGLSEPKIPALSLPGQFEIADKRAFVKFMTKASKVSDHIALELRETVLHATVDSGTTKVETDIPGVRTDNARPAIYRSHFPMEYLANILKGLPGNQAILKLGNDYPLEISAGKTRYLLAPRIESTD